MVKRILGLLGWLGVVFVFSALAISQLRPEWTWFRGLAIAGLVCTLLYVLSQWREIGRELSGRQARYGSLAAASVLVVLGILAVLSAAATTSPLGLEDAFTPYLPGPPISTRSQAGPAGPMGHRETSRRHAQTG